MIGHGHQSAAGPSQLMPPPLITQSNMLNTQRTGNERDNILEFSPFNFFHGINARRLLKGRSQLGKQSLTDSLKC
jgi:hypothetical protein